MVKNSQSNKNIIQINNLVKMAEEKKRRPRRRQVVQKEEEVVETQMPSRIMQQMPPQLQPIIQQSFPGKGPDQDLNKALRDAVSSQAAQLNEMRDQRDRENEMYAQAINGITSKISDKEERLFNKGQGRASNEASGPVEIAGTDVFADDEQPSIRVGRPKKYATEDQRREAKRKSAREYQARLRAAAAGNSSMQTVEAYPVSESENERWYGYSSEPEKWYGYSN